MEKRRMCPNCRAFITVNDRVCPYCEMQLGPRSVDIRGSAIGASFLPRANLTSMVILSLNCFFFLLELIVNSKFGEGTSISANTLLLMGCKFGPLIAHGQWWRLVTAGFLHGGLLHIGMNSYALIILVTEVEQFYGTARTIVAYFVATVAGFYLSYVQSPMSPSAGASAAAFGLIGIMLAMGLRRRNDPLVQMVRAQYTQWLIFSLVFSIFPGRIDLWAHVGGGIGGFLIGLIAGLPGLPGTPRELLWKALAGVSILITILAFILDFQSYRLLISHI